LLGQGDFTLAGRWRANEPHVCVRRGLLNGLFVELYTTESDTASCPRNFYNPNNKFSPLFGVEERESGLSAVPARSLQTFADVVNFKLDVPLEDFRRWRASSVQESLA
jgi:hypothetical protein